MDDDASGPRRLLLVALEPGRHPLAQIIGDRSEMPLWLLVARMRKASSRWRLPD